jgi:hypothetical protein
MRQAERGLVPPAAERLHPGGSRPPFGWHRQPADNIIRVAVQADEVGLDVFALGEHHNPPFIPSSPTTLLGRIAALTRKIMLSTSVTLRTTNDPVRIAEDYAMPQPQVGMHVPLRDQVGVPHEVHGADWAAPPWPERAGPRHPRRRSRAE